MTPKAVLFDLDETLIHRDAAIRRFIAAQYARFAQALAPLTAGQYAARFLDLGTTAASTSRSSIRR